MEDVSNDRTIGRTNVAPRAAVPNVYPSTNAAQQITSPHPAVPSPAAPPAAAPGAPFEWPTSASHYQLINRVGQGAFASVWRAHIINSGDKGEAGEEEGVQCAIKIMDLEHVNINISGELI